MLLIDIRIESILQRRPKLRLQILGIAALVLALQLLELAAAILYLKLFHAAPITLFSIHIVPWRLIQIAIMLPGDLLKIWYFWRIWIACSHAAGMLPYAVSKYRKTQMLWLSIQNFCIRTLLLQTVPLCLFAAYHLAKIGAAHPESAPWLFFAAQFVVMAVLLFYSGFMYVSGFGVRRFSGLRHRSFRYGGFRCFPYASCTAGAQNFSQCSDGKYCGHCRSSRFLGHFRRPSLRLYSIFTFRSGKHSKTVSIFQILLIEHAHPHHNAFFRKRLCCRTIMCTHLFA